MPEREWKSRYELINSFEKLLTEGDVTIVKCFLHISKEEQRERLQARLDNPNKRWKFSKGDLAERKLWDQYVEAYEDALTLCNTEHAPVAHRSLGQKMVSKLDSQRDLAENYGRDGPAVSGRGGRT